MHTGLSLGQPIGLAQNSGLNQATVQQPQPESSGIIAVRHLDQSVIGLLETLSVLEARLSPILRATPPTAVERDQAGKVGPSESALVGELRNQIERLQIARQAVEGLISRLDV
jgi:hypothetical protein